MTVDVAFASFAAGALCLFAVLVGQILIWSKGNSSSVLLGATLITLLWNVASMFQREIAATSFFWLLFHEILKNMGWFALLLSILGIRSVLFKSAKVSDNKGLVGIAVVSIGIPLAMIAFLLDANLVERNYWFFPALGGRLVLLGFLLNAIIGLVLLEQVIRNTKHYQQWHLKFLYFGLAVLFGFDLYLYSDALLFGRVQSALWESRGFVHGFSALFIAISVLRTNQQPIQLNISRRLVFHTGMLLATGVYLLVMASTGYYLQSSAGEEWGNLLQILFWLLSISVLFALIFSGRIRSLVKVYISRNLFSSKYDYREEWLRISRSLSLSDSEETLPDRAVHAIADIVDSPGGALWLSRDEKHYDQVTEVEMGWVDGGHLTADSPLIRFLQERNWVLDLDERDNPDFPVELPEWLKDWRKAWLLVPLVLHERLLGFILLRHSRIEYQLNWEDFDLLKTAAQQTASYLAQMTASEALSQARQFSAFNQMSAFVVHDIKTLNSQLSMMVKNAARHKSNPSFVEDMITTTEHAVQKMNFLLQHFKQDSPAGKSRASTIDLAVLLRAVVDSQKHLKPVPLLQVVAGPVLVQANEDELKSAIGHLVQNAQEATENDGAVTLVLESGEGKAMLRISDSGAGMTQEFIKKRLFRPFESTKGLSGMGVGVYQSREYVRKLGGDLQVRSQPGEGTEFTLTLTLVTENAALES